jgi:hypothetical protein
MIAPSLVIPAKAGIQAESEPRTIARWIPAFAGMTGFGDRPCAC